jgi:hypothetical protein
VIRTGMIVRTPDGEKLGRVASVGANDFTIERGHIFKHSFTAPLEHIIVVDDERDELLVRPVELPWQDREVRDMWFGAAETDEELEIKREDAQFVDELRKDPHPH